MWVVLGHSQGICGRSWPLLGLLWAVLGRDQVGKWPKPEWESDPTGGAPEAPNRPYRPYRPYRPKDPTAAKPSPNFFKRLYTPMIF